MALFGIAGAGPLISAIVNISIKSDSTYKRDYKRRIWDYRLIGRRWYAVIVFLIPIISVIALGAYAAYTSAFPQMETLRSYVSSPLSLIPFAAFMLFFGPFPEELGWRGPLQDSLESAYDWVRASVIVGACWACWHIPLFFVNGSYQQELANLSPLLVADFFLAFFPLSVIMGWIRHNTNRSILSAILFHFFTNYIGEVLDLPAGAMYVRTGIELVLAAVLAVSWFRKGKD